MSDFEDEILDPETAYLIAHPSASDPTLPYHSPFARARARIDRTLRTIPEGSASGAEGLTSSAAPPPSTAPVSDRGILGIPDAQLPDILGVIANLRAAGDLGLAMDVERALVELGASGAFGGTMAWGGLLTTGVDRGGAGIEQLLGPLGGSPTYGVDWYGLVSGDGGAHAGEPHTWGAPGDLLTEDEMDTIRSGRVMGSPEDERIRAEALEAIERAERMMEESIAPGAGGAQAELERQQREHAQELKEFAHPPEPEPAPGPSGNQNAPAPEVPPKQAPPKASMPGSPDAGPTGAPPPATLLPGYFRRQFAPQPTPTSAGPGGRPLGDVATRLASRLGRIRTSYDGDPNALVSQRAPLARSRLAVGPGARPPAVDAVSGDPAVALLLKAGRG